jgi:hypothetical protein
VRLGGAVRRLSDVPLQPGRGEARSWAAEELTGSEYAAERPGLVDRVITWLIDTLLSVEVPSAPGGALGLTVLLLAAAVLVAAALWRARGMSSTRGRREAVAVLGTGPRAAAEYRTSSEQHASSQRWEAAVLDRFRALARELEERAVLDPQPGRTADEVAGQAARWLPGLGGSLAHGARTFDDVAYGERPGSPAAYADLVRLDDDVRRARAVSAGPATSAPGATW